MSHDQPNNTSVCEELRVSLSASFDGELTGSQRLVVDDHLRTCPQCQGWMEGSQHLRRTLSLEAQTAPLDLADQVMAQIGPPQAVAGSWVRYALGVVAVSLVVLSLPALFVAGAEAEHSMRHVGAFGVALGIGLAWASWRPERAIGLVPLAVALVVAMLAGSAFDIATGRAAALSEAVHTLELVGVILLLLLANGGVDGVRRQLSSGFGFLQATPSA